jgi:predicted DNA-binding transcriptional regulator YafY
MDNLSISRRSAFRLLQALEELGFSLIDNQSRPNGEKIYRLSDSYVMKLPNISIPNPGFTKDEIDFVLSVLDLCIRIVELGGTSKLNTIREKIKAIMPKGDRSNV